MRRMRSRQAVLNQAVLTLGARIDDPTTFVKQLNSLLTVLTEEDVTEDPATGEDGKDGEESQ